MRPLVVASLLLVLAVATTDIPTIRARLDTVDDLLSRKVLDAKTAGEQIAFYLERASELAGEPMTRQKVSEWSSVKRFFTLVNIVYIFAAILLVVSLGWISVKVIVPLLSALPDILFELGLYGVTFWLLFGVKGHMFGIAELWFAFPGCLALLGTVMFTLDRHFEKTGNIDKAMIAITAICFPLWTVAAEYHDSELIGALSVVALQTLLTFSGLMDPFNRWLGFQGDFFFPRATLGAFALLVGGCYLHVAGLFPETVPADYATNKMIKYLALFNPALLYVSTFMYFLGLLILSSRWYYSDGKLTFWVIQIITVVTGPASLYAGVMLDVTPLQGIGGTLLAFWVMEKYIEISHEKVAWGWAMLGLAVLLYTFATFAQGHPQYFIPAALREVNE